MGGLEEDIVCGLCRIFTGNTAGKRMKDKFWRCCQFPAMAPANSPWGLGRPSHALAGLRGSPDPSARHPIVAMGSMSGGVHHRRRKATGWKLLEEHPQLDHLMSKTKPLEEQTMATPEGLRYPRSPQRICQAGDGQRSGIGRAGSDGRRSQDPCRT